MTHGKNLTHLHLTLIQLADRGPKLDALAVGRKAEANELVDYILDNADASHIDSSTLRHFLTDTDRAELDDWFGRTTNAYDTGDFGLSDDANGWLYLVALLNGPFRQAVGELEVPL